MTFALCRATLPVLAKCQLEFQPQGLNLKPNWSRMKSITFRSPAPPGSLPQKQCHHPLPPDSFNYSPWSRKHRDCNRGSRVDWLVWRNSCLMGRDQTPPRVQDMTVARSEAAWGLGVKSEVAQSIANPGAKPTLGTQTIQALMNHPLL